MPAPYELSTSTHSEVCCRIRDVVPDLVRRKKVVVCTEVSGKAVVDVTFLEEGNWCSRQEADCSVVGLAGVSETSFVEE